jgi:hypothetical protein
MLSNKALETRHETSKETSHHLREHVAQTDFDHWRLSCHVHCPKEDLTRYLSETCILNDIARDIPLVLTDGDFELSIRLSKSLNAILGYDGHGSTSAENRIQHILQTIVSKELPRLWDILHSLHFPFRLVLLNGIIF